MFIPARASILPLALLLAATVAPAAADSPVSPRVVGGVPVPLGKWPDVVAVMLRDGACTGTLIAPDVVVTAGHCVDAGPVEVIVDTIDYAEGLGERIPVAESHAYPEWYRTYDVGVLVLARPAKPAARTIALTCTANSALKRDAEVAIVGFGATTAWGDEPNSRLREATIRITDPTCTLDPACQAKVAPTGEFAAGGSGKDSCFGDSGGPVFASTPAGPALLGIVSRGLALSNAPCGGGGVYVRADRVASWIKQVTGRRLQRTSCRGAGDDGTEAALEVPLADSVEEADAGGCTAAPLPLSPTVLLVPLVVGVLRRRRRRG